MSRSQILLRYGLSAVAFPGGTALLMILSFALGFTEADFHFAAPVMIPALATAAAVLYFAGNLTSSSPSALQIIGGCTFLTICWSMGLMGLGGFLDAVGGPTAAGYALAASFLAGILASILVLICLSALALWFLKIGSGRIDRPTTRSS